MTEGFKRWLEEHPSTKKDYDGNPEWREQIFQDYQIETILVDKDHEHELSELFQWIVKFPIEAKNEFPFFYKRLESVIAKQPDHKTVNRILSIVEDFPNQRSEHEQMIDPTKRKFAYKQIELHIVALGFQESDSRVIRKAVAEVKEDLFAQLKFWRGQVIVKKESDPVKEHLHLHDPEEVEAFIKDQFQNAHVYGWRHFFPTEDEYEKLVSLIVEFFSRGISPKQEQDSILQKDRTKTLSAEVLYSILKKLKPTNSKVSAQKEFFGVVRCLSQFQDMTNPQVYKFLTTHGAAS